MKGKDIMKDITGKLLSVGDYVVFIPMNKYTYTLQTGVVVGFTAQKVRIQPDSDVLNRSSSVECLKFPIQVAKVDKLVAINC